MAHRTHVALSVSFTTDGRLITQTAHKREESANPETDLVASSPALCRGLDSIPGKFVHTQNVSVHGTRASADAIS